MTTATIRKQGDTVTYLGIAATVVHGNEPSGWTAGRPSATVSIRFDRPVPGMSRQMDVQASAVLKVA
jgi:hypothetical protein